MTHGRHLLVLAGAILFAACDPAAEFGPPSALTKGALDGSAVVGSTLSGVAVTVKDAEGRPVAGASVVWSADAGGATSPGASVTDAEGVATTAWTLGTTAGTQTLLASVDGLEATFTVATVADELAVLDVDHGGRVLHALADTLHLSVVAEDRHGNPVGSSGIVWSSLDGGVATVAAGVVTAVSEGTARVVAMSASFADTAVVEVDQIVAGIALSPSSPRVLVKAETLELAAVPVDSNGAAVDTVLTVAWASSAEGVVTVSGGTVQAVEVGEAVITATAGSLLGEAALKVKAGPRPTISSIAPSVAAPGDTITITGTDFSATPGLNAVTVAGIAASVLTATSSQITAMLDAGSLPCRPTSNVEVAVIVDELAATAQHPLAAALRHELATGESVTLTGGGVACNEIAGDGAYVISVFNAVSSAAATTAFRLRGTASGSVAAAPGGTGMAATMEDVDRRSVAVAPRSPVLRSDPEEVGHARVMRMNTELLRRLGSPDRTRSTALRSVSAVPAVGQIMAVRIPDLEALDFCTSYKAVNARVVHVGQHGVVLEDTASPLAGDIDAHWQTVGQEYDAIMHQLLLDYFGDPLILDPTLDDNQRLLMLFSKEVNDFEAGVAGFVSSGDFFTRAECPSSDVAEIFYGVVPTSAADGYDPGTVASWKRTMRSTVIHEVKHILSFASRIHQAGGGRPSYEATWLEEATARLAEEFYARAKYGYVKDGNTGYRASIHCEVRPTGWPECGEGSPYIMAKHYFAIAEYYNAVEQLSPLGRIDSDDATFYGSGWLFVRWALDQSGQDEATFVKALVGEPTLSGVANVSARTGRSFPEMLGDFSLGMATDDRAGVTPARGALAFPSWDTRDIFQGFHDDFDDHPDVGHLFTTPFPLFTRPLAFGDFQADVAELRGGTASIFELGGTITGTQLLELLSASGGLAPPDLGVAIMRVQ
ncbi:MAG: Ig-like domain-containing protein [Gemmatimonadetes bacterium]|nr:Ig-like domain-containing protein [Gemmatimonadota bacterium]